MIEFGALPFMHLKNFQTLLVGVREPSEDRNRFQEVFLASLIVSFFIFICLVVEGLV